MIIKKNISIISILALIVLATFTTIYVPQTSALDANAETISCANNDYGVSSEGRPCSEVNCNWRNIANNWPQEKGYKEDCSDTNRFIEIATVFGLTIFITVTFWFLSKKYNLKDIRNLLRK